jgi:hypothetical protein
VPFDKFLRRKNPVDSSDRRTHEHRRKACSAVSLFEPDVADRELGIVLESGDEVPLAAAVGCASTLIFFCELIEKVLSVRQWDGLETNALPSRHRLGSTGHR